jgi:hypothetical protein
LHHLVFDLAWRVKPPADGAFRNGTIPQAAIEELAELIDAVAQGNAPMLDAAKAEFTRAVGRRVVQSAPSTLRAAMYEAARNAPVFIDAMHAACQELKFPDGSQAVKIETMNAILDKFGIGYRIQGTNLLLREEIEMVSIPAISLLQKAEQEFADAANRSQELLEQGQPREAVQEILWLLESVATAFSGLSVGTSIVKGKYFNDIVKDLRHAKPGSILDIALRWLLTFHGYLSSPTGGGVRHGRALDLNGLEPHEAAFFCNLTRSYISYLLSEYKKLKP